MFGRQPTLPVDLILGIDNPNETHKTHSEYVQNLRQRLQESYTLAALNSKKAGERNKLRFDAKVRAAELVEGDRVLIRNVNIRGKHKLADKWEKSIHIVVKRLMVALCMLSSQREAVVHTVPFTETCYCLVGFCLLRKLQSRGPG